MLANARGKHDTIQSLYGGYGCTGFSCQHGDKKIDGKSGCRIITRLKITHVIGDTGDAKQAGLLDQ